MIVADCDQSSKVLARIGSLSSILTPPIRSASLALLAKNLAKALVAPFSDKAKTEEPLTFLFLKASACIEIKISAYIFLAFETLLARGT